MSASAPTSTCTLHAPTPPEQSGTTPNPDEGRGHLHTLARAACVPPRVWAHHASPGDAPGGGHARARARDRVADSSCDRCACLCVRSYCALGTVELDGQQMYYKESAEGAASFARIGLPLKIDAARRSRSVRGKPLPRTTTQPAHRHHDAHPRAR